MTAVQAYELRAKSFCDLEQYGDAFHDYEMLKTIHPNNSHYKRLAKETKELERREGATRSHYKVLPKLGLAIPPVGSSLPRQEPMLLAVDTLLRL